MRTREFIRNIATLCAGIRASTAAAVAAKRDRVSEIKRAEQNRKLQRGEGVGGRDRNGYFERGCNFKLDQAIHQTAHPPSSDCSNSGNRDAKMEELGLVWSLSLSLSLALSRSLSLSLSLCVCLSVNGGISAEQNSMRETAAAGQTLERMENGMNGCWNRIESNKT
jgi:hypothetical protein